MFYAYVLRSKKDGGWNSGVTRDIQKRFKRHNDGKILSTKDGGPFEVIYCEACLNIQDAYDGEKYLNSEMDKRYLRNRPERFLFLTGQA